MLSALNILKKKLFVLLPTQASMLFGGKIQTLEPKSPDRATTFVDSSDLSLASTTVKHVQLCLNDWT